LNALEKKRILDILKKQGSDVLDQIINFGHDE
jgi:hypothetical protein